LAVAMPANVSGLGVAQSRAGTHLARMFSLRVPEVPSIKSSILGGPRPFEAVVGVDLVLVLGRYLTVVEGRTTLDRILIGGDHQALLLVSHLDDLPRYERGLGAEEARLDTYILRLVVLVDEEVSYLTDLTMGGVVYLVT
jgi:hypothetical protein